MGDRGTMILFGATHCRTEEERVFRAGKMARSEMEIHKGIL